MKQFDYDFDTVTQKVVLKFGSNEGLSFEDEEVSRFVGFKGTQDTSHHGFIHIGYKIQMQATLRTDLLEIFQLISLADHS